MDTKRRIPFIYWYRYTTKPPLFHNTPHNVVLHYYLYHPIHAQVYYLIMVIIIISR